MSSRIATRACFSSVVLCLGLLTTAEPGHAAGTLYAVIHDGGASSERLVSVNPATAGLTSLGSGVAGCCGVGSASTIDTAGNVFFWIGTTTADSSTPRLFRFDTVTGNDLSSGGVALSTANSYNFIEWDSSTSTLYGFMRPAASQEQLVTINPTTGALTNVGSAITTCCSIQSASSALGNGQLYFTGALTTDGVTVVRLFSINLTTGAVTNSPTLVSTNSYTHLAFDPDNSTLYAMVRDTTAGAESVASINPSTGALTTIGSATASCCSTSGTAAYDSGSNIIYFTGGFTSDVNPRLMAFSTATGANVSSPSWPTGNNYNFLELDLVPPVPPDLAIIKSDGVTSVLAGGSVTYTITASHVSGDPATGASVVDTFPAACASVSWTCSGASGGTCAAAGSGNINDSVNLPAGGSVTYLATCTLSPAASGTLTNTASVNAPAGQTDPVPGNNSATDSDTILTPPSVAGTKTVTGTFSEGGAVTYVVTLTNTGTTAQGDNPGNELTDTLPADLTLVGAAASSGTTATAANTVTWNGAIAGGGSVTITIQATIHAGTLGHTVSNQGTIAFDGNGDGTNEATALTDDPSLAGGADPTSFVVAPRSVVEIPTLGPAGLALLCLALSSLAWVALRRRAA